MIVQKAHIYALQEAIVATDMLAVSARAPFMIKYYNFLTRNLTSLMTLLRQPPPKPQQTWFELVKNPSKN